MTVMSIDRLPDWAFPPQGGFTAADLDRLPDLPPHSELIDGSLVLVSPQASFHSLVLYALEHALRRTTPQDLRVRREMTVTLDRDQRPRRPAPTGASSSSTRPIPSRSTSARSNACDLVT